METESVLDVLLKMADRYRKDHPERYQALMEGLAESPETSAELPETSTKPPDTLTDL